MNRSRNPLVNFFADAAKGLQAIPVTLSRIGPSALRQACGPLALLGSGSAALAGHPDVAVGLAVIGLGAAGVEVDERIERIKKQAVRHDDLQTAPEQSYLSSLSWDRERNILKECPQEDWKTLEVAFYNLLKKADDPWRHVTEPELRNEMARLLTPPPPKNYYIGSQTQAEIDAARYEAARQHFEPEEYQEIPFDTSVFQIEQADSIRDGSVSRICKQLREEMAAVFRVPPDSSCEISLDRAGNIDEMSFGNVEIRPHLIRETEALLFAEASRMAEAKVGKRGNRELKYIFARDLLDEGLQQGAITGNDYAMIKARLIAYKENKYSAIGQRYYA